MSQKLLVNSFKWVEETPQFNKYFITLYNEDNDIKYFIKADVQYPEKLHEFYNSLPWKNENWILVKKNISFT